MVTFMIIETKFGNFELLKNGIENNIANAILIKFNQIGTVAETFKTINLAKEKFSQSNNKDDFNYLKLEANYIQTPPIF